MFFSSLPYDNVLSFVFVPLGILKRRISGRIRHWSGPESSFLHDRMWASMLVCVSDPAGMSSELGLVIQQEEYNKTSCEGMPRDIHMFVHNIYIWCLIPDERTCSV